MTRVFLDANILFSAAWREAGGMGALWERRNVQLVTSAYALLKARRNFQIKKPSAIGRLSRLADSVEISSARQAFSEDHGLPEKDLPILEAAAGSGCPILLTGDMTHFGHLIGLETEGVQVLTVSLFLATLAAPDQADG